MSFARHPHFQIFALIEVRSPSEDEGRINNTRSCNELVDSRFITDSFKFRNLKYIKQKFNESGLTVR